jgi:glucose-1-phosphate cytidylyltransferase
MKVVILAGGFGTRLSEETALRPKPMVEVGGHPIIWHIMNLYAQRGFRDFVVALGYKGEIVKDYFLRYHTASSDFTVDLATGGVQYHQTRPVDWRVSLIDTGVHSGTAGRLLRLKPLLQDGGTFFLTYGDGVSDVDLAATLAFHRRHGGLATLTAVRPPARFGTMTFENSRVLRFAEKVQTSEGWINGGFFVFEPGVLNYLGDDSTVLEEAPLEQLAADGQLHAYRHDGFWQCMDTLRDRNYLEELWQTGVAPWSTGVIAGTRSPGRVTTAAAGHGVAE